MDKATGLRKLAVVTHDRQVPPYAELGFTKNQAARAPDGTVLLRKQPSAARVRNAGGPKTLHSGRLGDLALCFISGDLRNLRMVFSESAIEIIRELN
jgi:hypothetical protein